MTGNNYQLNTILLNFSPKLRDLNARVQSKSILSVIEKLKTLSNEQIYLMLSFSSTQTISVWMQCITQLTAHDCHQLISYLKQHSILSDQQWIKLLSQTDQEQNSALNLLLISAIQDSNTARERVMEQRTAPEHYLTLFQSFNKDQWDDLMRIKNHSNENLFHHLFKLATSASTVANIMSLIKPKQLEQHMLQRDLRNHSPIEFIAHYYHNTQEIKQLIGKIGSFLWEKLLEQQKRQRPVDSVLHQAAQCQDEPGFNLFLSRLPHKHRALLLIKNSNDETVIDLAMAFQSINSLESLARQFSFDELVNVMHHQKKENQGERLLIRENENHNAMQSLFKRENSIIVLICLRLCLDIVKKYPAYAAAIKNTLASMIEHPTLEKKQLLIDQISRSKSWRQNYFPCLFSSRHRDAIEIVGSQCSIPQCYAII